MNQKVQLPCKQPPSESNISYSSFINRLCFGKISFTFSSGHNKSGRYVRGPQQWRRYNPQVSIILTTIATCHLRDGIIREFANRRGATLSNTQHTPPVPPSPCQIPSPRIPFQLSVPLPPLPVLSPHNRSIKLELEYNAPAGSLSFRHLGNSKIAPGLKIPFLYTNTIN